MARMVIDYDYIYNMGNKIKDYSVRYNDIIRKIEDNNNKIHDEWKSDNSDSIYLKIEKVIKDMDKEQDYMEKYADLLIDISDNFVSEDTKLAKQAVVEGLPTINVKGDVPNE